MCDAAIDMNGLAWAVRAEATEIAALGQTAVLSA
jgi:hypothetical protein